jgi:alpha-amylase/alpha-mannosidase (GH57 family)
MAALAAEHPDLRLTINLVPSLLDQLDEYVTGGAADPALDLARRPAADLTEEDRLALLDLFFSVPYRTLIAPFPRYAALFHKRGERSPAGNYRDALARYRAHDFLDLQVWFHLAWSGTTLRESPEVRPLLRKGDGFTEDEKNALLDLQARFLSTIVPMHARLQSEGIAELSTSPYFHPILPLLCDLESAREAIHDLPLPAASFRYPADARWHLQEAMRAMQRRFGARPSGVWPSEGSLSEETLRLMAECRLRWTASDEGILRHAVEKSGGSFHRGMIHAPHRVEAAGGESPAIFFRDQVLSDLIGFTYSTWQPDDAARDFVRRLHGVADESPDGVVSIILDGENAWEHYPGNGAAFLRSLYRALTTDPRLRPVTMTQALEEVPARGVARLRAGSWIGSSFTTWIGHPEKNRAWEMLASARQAAGGKFGAALMEPGSGPAARAWQALAAAEGSDWFWWFGDDHSSEQDAIFDEAFRDQLRAVYEESGVPAPADLDHPIKVGRPLAWSRPSGPISPTIDGAVTDYFEWLGAGECDASQGQGSMHQGSGLIRRVLYGRDERCLYVRVDPDQGTVQDLLGSLDRASLRIETDLPAARQASFSLSGRRVRGPGEETVRFAAGRVLEAQFPLGGTPEAAFHVSLVAGERLVQRLPRDGAIRVSEPSIDEWRV